MTKIKVERRDLVGLYMLGIGTSLLIGWFFTDKVHGVEKFVIVAALILIVLGAHLLSTEHTAKALASFGDLAEKLKKVKDSE